LSYGEVKEEKKWLNTTEKISNDKDYTPPFGFYSSKMIVEYYPYNYFGNKLDFNDEVKIQHRREQKFKRILKHKNEQKHR
jgi:hypothetical protein